MFFNTEEDDSDFLSSSGGSKLGALFGIDKASAAGGNDSLHYIAPKQPKKAKSESSGDGSGGVAMLNATAVQTYKYVDGNYANQGKLGAAVIGNHRAKDYKLLLYVSKQQQVTVARITSSFAFTANGANPLEAVVSQDMLLGDGSQLELGDSAEVKYTGWLLQNSTFGQVFDSNTSSDKLFRFKLGKGKVIKGWDDGMIGMKKSGKRLLVIPPNLAYGANGMGNRVPPNSTLIFEVEVVRVKLAKDASFPSDSPIPEPEKQSESDVKARSRSISEQLSQAPKSEKARLISRMAKMGKPMLPTQSVTAAMPDSDEEETLATSPSPVDEDPPPIAEPIRQPKPRLPANKPHQQHQHPIQQQYMAQPAQPVVQPQPQQYMPPQGSNPGGAVALYQPMQNPMAMQHQQTPYSMAQPYQQQPIQQPIPVNPYPNPYQAQQHYPPIQPQVGQPSDAGMTLETRQQNTEIRMSITSIGDKVDKISEKIDRLQIHGASSAVALPRNTNMEAGVLLQNIQKMVQESERLKKEVFEKSTRIESQNEKIAELLQRNQSFVEQSNNILEQRNDTFKLTAASSQGRVLTLEQEKVQLTTELSAATSQVSSSQLEVATLRKKEADVRQDLIASQSSCQQYKEEVSSLQTQITENEMQMQQVSSTLKENKHARKQAENKLSNVEEELSDVKAANETLEQNLSERKKKAASERRKLEEEVEEMKMQYEEEIQSLKDKLRKQKTSTDSVTTLQAASIEEELNATWKVKSDRLLKAVEDKHQRHLGEVQEERQELQDEIKQLNNKLVAAKSNQSNSSKAVSDLRSQIEDLGVWKTKYDNLHSQASTMKNKYEDTITELNDEKEELEEKLETYKETIQSLKAGSASPSGLVVDEVKKVMNSVFQSLRRDFNQGDTYTGAKVLSSLLNTIKVTTMQLTQGRSKAENLETDDGDGDGGDDDDDDDDDDGESDEEEIDNSEEKEDTESEDAASNESQNEEDNVREKVDQAQENSNPESEENFEEEIKITTAPDDVEPVVTLEEVDASLQPTDKEIAETTGTANTNKINQISIEKDIVKKKCIPVDNDTDSDQEDVEIEKPPEIVDVNGDQNGNGDDLVAEIEDLEVVEESRETPGGADSPPPGGVDSPPPDVAGSPPPDGADSPPPDVPNDNEPIMNNTFFDKENPALDTKDKDQKKSDMGPLFSGEEDEEDNLFVVKKKVQPTKNPDDDDEEDLRPKPPPPLFGDDDDDDDLDWLG